MSIKEPTMPGNISLMDTLPLYELQHEEGASCKLSVFCLVSHIQEAYD